MHDRIPRALSRCPADPCLFDTPDATTGRWRIAGDSLKDRSAGPGPRWQTTTTSLTSDHPASPMRRRCAAIASNRPRGSTRLTGGPSDSPLLAGCGNSSLLSIHGSKSVLLPTDLETVPTPALAARHPTIGLSGRPPLEASKTARADEWLKLAAVMGAVIARPRKQPPTSGLAARRLRRQATVRPRTKSCRSGAGAPEPGRP